MTDDGDMRVADDFERVESLLRSITTEDRVLVAPPSDVWDAIEAELTATDAADGRPGDNVVPLHRRRPGTTWALTAVAAATIVVAGIVAVNLSGDDTGPTVVAGASLAYDPVAFDALGADSAAHVNLLADDGSFRIEIDDADLRAPTDEPADLELWLIQPDPDGAVADLVSLGIVDPDDPGTFEVPASYDPDVYSVVDISVEPRDGDDSHSGRSILRAPLDFA